MTNLDWLLQDKERAKKTLLDLEVFIEENDIRRWWCENECPVNDLCSIDEDGDRVRCKFEYAPDYIDVITDWFKAEHIE